MQSARRTEDIARGTGRNLPLFHDTRIEILLTRLVPILFALMTGWEGHTIFEGIRGSFSEDYSGTRHIGFMVFTAAPAVGLFFLRSGLAAERYAAISVIFYYSAVMLLAQQVSATLLN